MDKRRRTLSVIVLAVLFSLAAFAPAFAADSLIFSTQSSGGSEGDNIGSTSYKTSVVVGQPSAVDFGDSVSSSSWWTKPGFRGVDLDLIAPYAEADDLPSLITVSLADSDYFDVEWDDGSHDNVNFPDHELEGWGIYTYDVQYKVETTGSWTNWASKWGTTDTGGQFGAGDDPVHLAYGKTYCFRVKAKDLVGNEGDYGAEKCTKLASPPENDDLHIVENTANDDEIELYAGKTYTWRATVTDPDGYEHLDTVKLILAHNFTNPDTVLWVRDGEVFSTNSTHFTVENDPDNSSNDGINTWTIDYVISFNWSWDAVDDPATYADDRLVSSCGALRTETDFTDESWKLENDLRVSNLSFDDTQNPDVVVSVSGYLDYQDVEDPNPPEDCADVKIEPVDWTAPSSEDTDLTADGLFELTIRTSEALGTKCFNVYPINIPDGAGYETTNDCFDIDRVLITGISISGYIYEQIGGGSEAGESRFWDDNDGTDDWMTVTINAQLEDDGSALTGGTAVIGYEGDPDAYGGTGAFSSGSATKNVEEDPTAGNYITRDNITVDHVTEGGNNVYGPEVNLDGWNISDIGWDNESPSTVTLNSPSGCIGDNTPDFDWSDATDGASGVRDYTLQVDTSGGDYSTPVKEVTGLTSSEYAWSGDALADGDYIWRVITYDNVGNSTITGGGSFSVDVTPPPVATLLSPENEACIATLTPTLDWTDVTDGGCAGLQDYHLQIADNPDFTGASDYYPTSSSYDVTDADGLVDNGTYYWRVSSRDNNGNESDFTVAWSFTTDVSAPPVPTLNTPADGACLATLTPSLIWNGVEDGGCAGLKDYHIQVDDDDEFSSCEVDEYVSGPTTSYDVGAGVLSENVTYYWRVSSRDNNDLESDFSAYREFSIDVSPPSVPTLASPANDSWTNDNTPEFVWNGSTDDGCYGMFRYQLQVDDNADFSSPVTDVYISYPETTYTLTAPLSDNVYYWHVRAEDGGGHWSDYSASWTIKVDTHPPAITYNDPTAGATIPWTNTDPAPYDVDFIRNPTAEAASSPLDFAQYQIGAAGWTDIFSGGGYDDYTTDWSIPWGDLAEGENEISLRVYDEAGNYTEHFYTPGSFGFMIQKDTEVPTIIYNYPSAGDSSNWYNADPGIVIDIDFGWGGNSPLDYARYQINGSDWQSIFEDNQASDYTDNWSIDWSMTREGLDSVNIVVADSAGNVLTHNFVTGSTGFLFRVDTTPPTITYTYPVQGGVTEWYAEDPGAVIDIDFGWVENSPLDYAQYKIDGSDWQTIFDADQSSDYTTDWSVNWSMLADAANEISVRVFDVAGNSTVHSPYADSTQANPMGFLYRKDATIPDIVAIQCWHENTHSSEIYQMEWQNDGIVSFTWTDAGSPSGDVYFYEYNTDPGSTIDGTEPTTTDAYVDDYNLSEGGNRYFHVKPRNGAGTWGEERVFNIYFDETMPDITYNYPTAGGGTYWYAEDPGNVIDIDFLRVDDYSPLNYARYRINDGAWHSIFEEDRTSDFNDNWGVAWDDLDPGTNEIDLEVADSAGNVLFHNYVADASGFLFKKTTVKITSLDCYEENTHTTPISEATWQNDGEVSFVWAGENFDEHLTFYYRYDDSSDPTINADPSAADGNTGATTYDNDYPLDEGEKYYHVQGYKSTTGEWSNEAIFEIWYDGTAPTTAEIYTITEGSDYCDIDSLSGWLVFYGDDGVGSFTVKVKAADTLSGLDKATFPNTVSDGGDDSPPEEGDWQFDWVYSFDAGGETYGDPRATATVYVYDKAGNFAPVTFDVDQDYVNPSAPTSITMNADSWDDPSTYDNDIQIFVEWDTASPPDGGGSGICSYYGDFENTAPTSDIGLDLQEIAYVDEYTGPDWYRYYIRAKDRVGNWSEPAVDSIYIERDLTPPEIVSLDLGANGDFTDTVVIFAKQNFTWRARVRDNQGAIGMSRVDLHLWVNDPDGAYTQDDQVVTWRWPDSSFTTESSILTVEDSKDNCSYEESTGIWTVDFVIQLDWTYAEADSPMYSGSRLWLYDSLRIWDTALNTAERAFGPGTEAWNIENDLVVTSAEWDSTKNPDSMITLTGVINYQGADDSDPNPPEDVVDVKVTAAWGVSSEALDLTEAGNFEIEFQASSNAEVSTFDIDMFNGPTSATLVSQTGNTVTTDRVRVTSVTISNEKYYDTGPDTRYWDDNDEADDWMTVSISAEWERTAAPVSGFGAYIGYEGAPTTYGMSGDFSTGTATKDVEENPAIGEVVRRDNVTVGKVEYDGETGNNPYGEAVSFAVSVDYPEIGWDNQKPTTGTVAIDGGADWTPDTDVSVTASGWSDGTGAGIEEYWAKPDGSPPTSSDYVSTDGYWDSIPLSSEPDPGWHYVCVKAIDNVGNISDEVCDSIRLDTEGPAPPTLTLSDPDGCADPEYTSDRTVDVSIDTTDGDNVTRWCLSETYTTLPDDTAECWVLEMPTSFTLSEGDGSHTVYLWVKDPLDRWNYTTDTIILDTEQPDNPTLLVSDLEHGWEDYTDSFVVSVEVASDEGVWEWVVTTAEYYRDHAPAPCTDLWDTEPTTYHLGCDEYGVYTFYAWVMDSAGNVNPGEPTVWDDITYVSGDTVGTPASYVIYKQFVLMGVPVGPLEGTPRGTPDTLFGDDIYRGTPPPYGFDKYERWWRITHYRPARSVYDRFTGHECLTTEGGNFPPCRLGVGYWFIQNVMPSAELDVYGFLADTTEPFAIPLDSGYNVVANPFFEPDEADTPVVFWGDAQIVNNSTSPPETLSVEDAATSGWISNTAWKWSASGYQPVLASDPMDFPDNCFMEWEGFWVKQLVSDSSPSSGDLDLLLYVHSQAPGRRRLARSAIEPRTDTDEWTITLNLAGTERSSNWRAEAKLGWRRNATYELDPMFDAEAPQPFMYPDKEFVRIYSASGGGELLYDFVGDETHKYRWDVVIDSRFPGSEKFILSWELENIPAGAAVYLVDGTNNFLVDMREKEEYTFVAKRNVLHPICVYVNTDGEIVLKDMKEEARVPTTYELSQNQPNPFNPTTYIRFGIPEDAGVQNVRLEIFNILGQRVKVLVDDEFSPGRYEAIWDATNDDGIELPSGVYIYKLKAGDFEQSRKMTLLR